jgi:hypothetical protein
MKKLLIGLLLSSLSASANICGLYGSIKERVEDCEGLLRAKKNSFVLVTRVEEYDGESYTYKEIYKDKRTGSLWGEKIPVKVNQREASKLCESYVDRLNRNIDWKLPSLAQFKRAHRHGLEEAMPKINEHFWTSSLPMVGRKQGHVFTFSNRPGKLYTYGGAYYPFSFTRCIGKASNKRYFKH